jgi:hypothetical protein
VTGQGKCHRSFFADDKERAFLEPEESNEAKKTVVLDRGVKEEMTAAEKSVRLGMKTRGSPSGAASPANFALCVEPDCLT